jgi:putative ABC transport system permease protein
VICIACVLPLSQLPVHFGIPLPGYLAMFLLFVGFSLTAPWFIESMGRIFSPILYRTAGISAYLGGRYVGDSGTRTAVSVGALMTAVALYTALVIMIFSFRQTVALWTRQTVSGDLFLTTHMGELNRFQYPIPKNVVHELRHLKSDVDLVPSRRFPLTYGGFPYELEVFDLAVFFRYGDFVWLEKAPGRLRKHLIDGDGVLISEVFSNRTGLNIGDVYAAWVDGSRVALPVLGVIRDYRTDGGVVFYSWRQFKKRFHDPQWSGVRFFFRNRHQNMEKAVADLRREIIARCGNNLDMISGAELRASILRVFDETFAITTILLLIALIIAALGIATTLAVLVLERSRQLNTLFAVGASYGQIRSMIFWEAAFMVTVGQCAGLACGFLLSQLLIHVINRQSFGWTFMFGVDWTTLGISLPLIILTALAAALPAVRLVFRKPPASILRA